MTEEQIQTFHKSLKERLQHAEVDLIEYDDYYMGMAGALDEVLELLELLEEVFDL